MTTQHVCQPGSGHCSGAERGWNLFLGIERTSNGKILILFPFSSTNSFPCHAVLWVYQNPITSPCTKSPSGGCLCMCARAVDLKNGRKGPVWSTLSFCPCRTGMSGQDPIALVLEMQYVCWVLWRELNNHAVYKYLHSLIVFGQHLLGWVTPNHVPLMPVMRCWPVNRFHFLHLVANGCSFSLVTPLLQNGNSVHPARVPICDTRDLQGCWINKA